MGGGKGNSRRGRQPTRQPTAEDSTTTQDQTTQSETTPTPQPQPTRSPQPAHPAEQQQPRRAGPVTRSSRLAPIEKQPGRTFSREEARKRDSSLGAPTKGRKRTHKTEAQLLALSTQEVGLGEALQVASVTLQDPTDPPSGTEVTAGDRTQVEISCERNQNDSPERSPIVERLTWYCKQLKRRSEQATEKFLQINREYLETMKRHRRDSNNENKKYSDRDSDFNNHTRPNMTTPTTIHPPNLVNKQSPVDNLSEVLPTRSFSRDRDAQAKHPTSEGSAHGSAPVFTLIPPYILDQKKETVSKHYSPMNERNLPPLGAASGSAFSTFTSLANLPPVPAFDEPLHAEPRSAGQSMIDLQRLLDDPISQGGLMSTSPGNYRTSSPWRNPQSVPSPASGQRCSALEQHPIARMTPIPTAALARVKECARNTPKRLFLEQGNLVDSMIPPRMDLMPSQPAQANAEILLLPATPEARGRSELP